MTLMLDIETNKIQVSMNKKQRYKHKKTNQCSQFVYDHVNLKSEKTDCWRLDLLETLLSNLVQGD